MPVNVKLLKKVRKLIAEEPRRLQMGLWGLKVTGKTAPPCGTVACLAGWVVLAARPSYMRFERHLDQHVMAKNKDKDTPTLAAELLGIPESNTPFFNVKWKLPEVLAWIDRQIDAASK